MEKFYFLEPNSKENQKCLNHIIDLLRSSKHCKLCIAYFTHDKIADEIVSRTRKKNLTDIIVNKHDIIRPQNGTESSEIRISSALAKLLEIDKKWESGYDGPLKIKTLGRDKAANSPYSIMHHKFIIADNIVGFGSLNLTYQAFSNHFENFTFTDNSGTKSRFNSEFDKLWTKGETFFAQNGKLRIITCPNCHIEGGIDFESYGAFCTHCQHKFRKTGFE